MMYHGMVGEMTRLLSCSYEKGQLFIRTPPFHDASHRVGTREPCYFVIRTPLFHDALHRVGSWEPCYFVIRTPPFTMLRIGWVPGNLVVSQYKKVAHPYKLLFLFNYLKILWQSMKIVDILFLFLHQNMLLHHKPSLDF